MTSQNTATPATADTVNGRQVDRLACTIDSKDSNSASRLQQRFLEVRCGLSKEVAAEVARLVWGRA